MKVKAILVTGLVLAISTGIVGFNVAGKTKPEEFKVLESGVVEEVDANESDSEILSDQQVSRRERAKEQEKEAMLLCESNLRKEQEKVKQEAESKKSEGSSSYFKTEEEWTALAAEALDEYFDVDVSNLKSSFVEFDADEKYGLEASIMVLFSENMDVESNAPFYNVIFDPADGAVKEVYDTFSDTADGKKTADIPVTVEEAKKMAEEYIADKQLGKKENLEYIGGKQTSEGRIHVSFKIGGDKSISVGIDTYTNEIKSFFIRSVESAEVMIFSSMEDAVG